jgi:hypothetical protein
LQDKGCDRQKSIILSKPELIHPSRNFRRVNESILHSGVRRVKMPGNRDWRQLLRHYFANYFAVFLT